MAQEQVYQVYKAQHPILNVASKLAPLCPDTLCPLALSVGDTFCRKNNNPPPGSGRCLGREGAGSRAGFQSLLTNCFVSPWISCQ